jgi:tetratricopeptide (TPR) repeat protein
MTSGPAAAMNAQDLFDDGNRLFRDDLYWAALLRYKQASEAGMNTALLHYNTGVAHYKAGQHIRARESLKKASRSPNLEPVAHFNLGLNAYAAGIPDEAISWFRLARDQQQNQQVSDMARKAIGRIRKSQRSEDPVIQYAERKQKEKDTFDLDMYAHSARRRSHTSISLTRTCRSLRPWFSPVLTCPLTSAPST